MNRRLRIKNWELRNAPLRRIDERIGPSHSPINQLEILNSQFSNLVRS